MTTIYHNPRCRKSRETLAILEEKTEDITIVKYLETPPSVEELTEIIKFLNISPIDLVRKNETVWKENYKGKEITNTELISVLSKHPILIERPIVIKDNKAIIGRPPQKVVDIL
ncbi:arsenate reductase (glutaredoxin) [Aquimarina algiphila]|uniref:Arsenate reductase (Glutaredoxin) n=1 Tax=Aquimarina algiphila TaxID=2047982 RepID=A0A554VLJ3_9FLAO|nr:arsenate reductase (glutaredoxin) [Aquimarina algiphila]TSE09034.1 arsenate reductase (glutaredoxin) [Aquimarina algiphila]